MKTVPDEIDRAILIELGKYPPSSLHDIGAIVNRSHVTVRQHVNWLIDQGWVRKVKNGQAILTVEGLQYLEHIEARKTKT